MAGRARPARQFPEPTLQRVLVAGCRQRLERPPACGAVAPEHVIVVAEPGGGQAARLARRRRHRQHAVGCAKPQVANPAAAETSSFDPFGQVTGIRRVETLAHTHRAGGHDVAATGPGTQQRRRVRVGSHQPQHVDRAQVPVQLAAHRPGRVLSMHPYLRRDAATPSTCPIKGPLHGGAAERDAQIGTGVWGDTPQIR